MTQLLIFLKKIKSPGGAERVGITTFRGLGQGSYGETCPVETPLPLYCIDICNGKTTCACPPMENTMVSECE